MRLLELEGIPNQPYPELRDVLESFVTGVQRELAGNLVGFYLSGSLATGDFDLDSDVDFLVVTMSDLTEANLRNLQELRIRVYELGSYPAVHLEGSFTSIHDLNDWHTVGIKELYYFDNGSTAAEHSTHDNKWHVRWILRERGITLVGRPPKEYMQPIPEEELFREMKTAMRQTMAAFEEALDQPLTYWNSQFGQSFAVLTFCRMLHTLHTGTVRSKKASAMWAGTIVAPEWIRVIDQAWEDRKGVRFCLKIKQQADRELLVDTLAFMRAIMAQVEEN